MTDTTALNSHTTTSCGAPGPPPDRPAYVEDALRRGLARAALARNLLPRNKAVLFEALERADVAPVVVLFDGEGDSGQIESTEVFGADEKVMALPPELLDWHGPDDEGAGVVSRPTAVADAIETLVYDLLEAEHDGWEINEGAFGEFVFDVADREIRLEYNERTMSYDTTEHAW